MWARRRSPLGQPLFVRIADLAAQAGCGQQPRPQASLEQLVQGRVEVRERLLNCWRAAQVTAKLTDLGHQPRTACGQGLADVLQDPFLGDPLQPQAAAGRQVRKAAFDLAIEFSGRLGADRPQTRREAELAALGPDEIQYGQAFLLVVQAQATSQLLQVDGQALRGPQEQDRVQLGDVDAFVVQIDDEDEVDFAAAESLLRRAPLVVVAAGRQGQRWQAVFVEEPAP